MAAIVSSLRTATANAETPSTAPSAFEYSSAAASGTASVSGTSSLHDWTVKGTSITGKLTADGEWKAGAAPAVVIKSIDLTIPVNSLKSTEGGGMDNTMYDAMKMKANPLITYALTSATLKSPPTKDDPNYHYDAVGRLTIAGTMRPVNLTLDLKPADGGAVSVTTQITLKMTDFGVSPPTAMFGMIKSGNEVTVKVNWQLATKAH